MATVQGVDSSYDELTLMEVQCLRDRGIRIFVQALTALPRTGLQQPAHRISNLRNAATGGLATAGYLLIGPAMTGEQAVFEARRDIPVQMWNRLKFVAVDVEVAGISDTEILAALEEVERLGQRAIVYTSWNAWNTLVIPQGSTLIADKGYGLWYASWNHRRHIDFSLLPFGGWERDLNAQIVGHQWSGGTIICGQSVDQNTFEEYILLPVPAPSPEPVFVPSLVKSDLQLAIVKEPLLDVPSWWLTSYPLVWKLHITNLHYMDYMQKKQDWPKSIWKLTPNQSAIFTGLPYLGQIPAAIREGFSPF